jgi:hypothetical protein
MKAEDETPKTEPIRAGVSAELPEPEQERIARQHAVGRATAFAFFPGRSNGSQTQSVSAIKPSPVTDRSSSREMERVVLRSPLRSSPASARSS